MVVQIFNNSRQVFELVSIIGPVVMLVHVVYVIPLGVLPKTEDDSRGGRQHILTDFMGMLSCFTVLTAMYQVSAESQGHQTLI